MGKYSKVKAPAEKVATRASRRTLVINKSQSVTPSKTPAKTPTKSQNVTPNKMSTRKSGNVSRQPTPNKASKKTRKIYKSNPMAERTHYTVREDAITLITMKQNPNETQTIMCQKLAEILNHSSESIRDRIKRYLSKLSKRDEKVIIEANQKIPDHYIYFMNDKSHNKKNISHISIEPPLITGKSLTLRDRKNVAKLHRHKIMQERQRKKIMLEVMQNKSNNLIYNTDENVTALEIDANDQNDLFSETRSPFKTAPTMEDIKKLTPTRSVNVKEDAERQRLIHEELTRVDTYKSKLRKRDPEEVAKKYKMQTYDFDIVPEFNEKYYKFHRKNNNAETTPLEDNIEMFLHQLTSETPNDVFANAEILSEIVDNLALTFNLTTDNIVEIIKGVEGQVNVEKVRSEILVKNHL